MTTQTLSVPMPLKSLRTVALAYALVLAHAIAVAAAGGLERVPLLVFGLCQFTPWVAAWWVMRDHGGLLPRVRELLTPKPWGAIALSWAVGAAVLLGACGLAAARGDVTVGFGPELTARYPLAHLVPAFVLDPRVFVPFLLLIAPLLHGLNAFGEEVLWRGILLDQMVGEWPRRWVGVVNGVFWGLWHAPMVAILGWDFPGHPVAGILAITAAQVSWSVFMVEVRLRTKSLWPAIVMHAVANALTIGLFDRMVDHSQNLVYSPWGLWGAAAMAGASVMMGVSRVAR